MLEFTNGALTNATPKIARTVPKIPISHKKISKYVVVQHKIGEP